MTWLSEYKNSLKNIHAEELLDIYLFRPFAFVIVKLLYPLPITPNHYSLVSFLAGMAAAYSFLHGRFVLGAFFFFLFAVLDCCDGMQARMKKNGTEFGRFVDGLVDYSSNIACYICLAIGVSKFLPMTGSIPTSYLVIAAGVSKALHSIMYDHYLMEYLSYDRGSNGFVQQEIEAVRKKLKEAKENPHGPKLRSLILWIYLGFSSLQASNGKNTHQYDSKNYVEKNQLAIQMWGMIGPAWHILILIAAFFFKHPEWLFTYAIIWANLWMLGMLFYQQKIFKSLITRKKSL